MAEWNAGIKLLLASYDGKQVTISREKNALSDFIRTEGIEAHFEHLFRSEKFFDGNAFKDAPRASTKGTNLQHYFNNLVFSPSRNSDEHDGDLGILIAEDVLQLPLKDNFIRWKWFIEGVADLKKSVKEKEFKKYQSIWTSIKIHYINPFDFFAKVEGQTAKRTTSSEGLLDADSSVHANRVSSEHKSNPAPRESGISGDVHPEFKIFVGPPGCGKTREVKNLVTKNNQEHVLIQIHPSFGYEDLVEGLKPLNFSDGQVRYDVVEGPLRVLAHMASNHPAKILCLVKKMEDGLLVSLPMGSTNRFGFKKINISDDALTHPTSETFNVVSDEFFLPTKFVETHAKVLEKKANSEDRFISHVYIRDISWGTTKYALILDELNRGNVPQLLGELIYLLGEEGADFTLPVKLQYSQETMTWPSKLSIYATMNSADVSTDRLDQAIKRRFAMNHVGPNEKVFSSSPTSFNFLSRMNERLLGVFPENAPISSLNELYKYCGAQTNPERILVELNNKLITEASSFGISHVYEKLIGQSYFLKICRKTADCLEGRESAVMRSAVLFIESLEVFKEEIVPALTSILNADAAEINRFLKEFVGITDEKFSAYQLTDLEKFVEKLIFHQPAKITSLEEYKQLRRVRWQDAA